jgi:hypothetical protein
LVDYITTKFINNNTNIFNNNLIFKFQPL